MTLKSVVADRLREIQANPFEAARSAGLERSFLNDLLIDRKKSVRQDTMPALARALDWSLHDLQTALAESNAGKTKPSAEAGPRDARALRAKSNPRQQIYLLRGTVQQLSDDSVTVVLDALVEGIYGPLSTLTDPALAKDLASVALRSILGASTAEADRAEASLARIVAGESAPSPRKRRAR